MRRRWGLGDEHIFHWKERTQMSSFKAFTGKEKQKIFLLSWHVFLLFYELNSWHILCLIKRSQKPLWENKNKRQLFLKFFFFPFPPWFSSYNKRQAGLQAIYNVSHFELAFLDFSSSSSVNQGEILLHREFDSERALSPVADWPRKIYSGTLDQGERRTSLAVFLMVLWIAWWLMAIHWFKLPSGDLIIW